VDEPMDKFKLDYESAKLYLIFLNGNKPIHGTKFQFTFFDDKKGGMRGGEYTTLKEAWPTIVLKNKDGCGIFITVNETNKPAKNGKSTNKDIIGIRAVWRDIDNPPPKSPELDPTFTVNSSINKWHDYWIIDNENVSFEEWNKVMTIMVNDYGADSAAKDISRVLRLPGTYHLKNEPKMVTLNTAKNIPIYKWSDLKEAFTTPEDMSNYQSTQKITKQSDIGYLPLLENEIEEILNLIPCEQLEEKEWWKITVSIKRCAEYLNNGHKNIIFKIWDDWCKSGNNYDRLKNLKTWKHIDGKYLDITLGTLRWYATEFGWQPSNNRELIERYIYCQDGVGSYYDTQNKIILTKDVFNETNLRNFPGGKNIPKANVIFQKHSERRIVQGYAWLPLPYGEENKIIFENYGKLYINEWNGFAITPIKGDISIWLELVEYLIPATIERNHVLDWMSFTIQKPHIKINYQILHIGQEGVGKDVMYSPLSIIFGECAEDIDHEKAASQYEDVWAKKKFVTIQEIYKPSDKKFINLIKTKAASTSTGMVRLNIKCQHQVLQPNLVSFVAMSNHEDCMHLSPTERRYLVIKSFFPPKPNFDYAYFANKWMREEQGASKIFYFLLNRDLSKFDHGKLPMKTDSFYELVDNSRAEYEVMIEDWTETNYSIFKNDLICTDDVTTLLIKFNKKNVSFRNIAKALYKSGWKKLKKRGQKKVGKKNIKTPYLYSKIPDKYNKKTPVDLWEIWAKRIKIADEY
jgi:primase-like protein/DNA primase RepB-like protein